MTEILAAQDTSIGPAGSRKNADVTAWVTVAAGALGAMLATLDISIVNSALPVIQGEIGATGAEGTWIATSFLVAEIVVTHIVFGVILFIPRPRRKAPAESRCIFVVAILVVVSGGSFIRILIVISVSV